MRRDQVVQLSREWRIGEEIDKGGFGRVHEATDGQIEAAAKFVPKAPGADRDLLAEELSDVPNVVPILDSGEFEDNYVIVMPRAECSLRDFMASTDFDREKLVIEVLQNISECLAALDEQVVHRDIKPGNILWLDDRWCLTDFGIARYAEATTAPYTRKYAMSPPYASPERWRSERATNASDVYSLGIVAYEIAAGHPPFNDPDPVDPSGYYREQHLHAPIPPVEHVPQRIGALIEECLYKAADARPSAANLLARLDRLPQQPSSPGFKALQEAHHSEVTRRAEVARQDSERMTEAERRQQLAKSAEMAYDRIIDEIVTTFTGSASAIELEHMPRAKILRLGKAELVLSVPQAVSDAAWNWQDSLFDVMTVATIWLEQSDGLNDYEGRSHSLWYCDAQENMEYAWFETAFMRMFSNRRPISQVGHGDPFALEPGERAALALSPGISGIQAAWPFNRMAPGDLDEFADRWANWFAQASEGRLSHPSSMPERDPRGSWRRG